MWLVSSTPKRTAAGAHLRRLPREGTKQGADPNLLQRCWRQHTGPRTAQIAVVAMTSLHTVISRHPTCGQHAFVPTCHQRRQRLSQGFSGRRDEHCNHSASRRPRVLRVSAIAQEALTTPAPPPARKPTGTVFVSGAHCGQRIAPQCPRLRLPSWSCALNKHYKGQHLRLRQTALAGERSYLNVDAYMGNPAQEHQGRSVRESFESCSVRASTSPAVRSGTWPASAVPVKNIAGPPIDLDKQLTTKNSCTHHVVTLSAAATHSGETVQPSVVASLPRLPQVWHRRGT